MNRFLLSAVGVAALASLGFMSTGPAHAWATKCNNNVDAQIDDEYRIYFHTSGNELSEESIERIDRAHSIATARDVAQLCIVGQASKEGDAKRNANLAYGRAEAVAKAFVARGWRRDQIVVKSKGESWGFMTDWLTDDSAADRRVDVTFSY